MNSGLIFDGSHIVHVSRTARSDTTVANIAIYRTPSTTFRLYISLSREGRQCGLFRGSGDRCSDAEVLGSRSESGTGSRSYQPTRTLPVAWPPRGGCEPSLFHQADHLGGRHRRCERRARVGDKEDDTNT